MDHNFLQPDSTEYRTSNPSVADILRLKRYLQCKLPMELIDIIIDDASYWARSSVSVEHPSTPIHRVGKKAEHSIYLRTLPLGIPGTEGDFSLVEEDFMDGGAAWTKKLWVGCPEDPSPTISCPCRKIEFQLWHRDDLATQFAQTFESFVWFDAIIEKLQTPVFAHDIVEWPAHLLFEEIDPDTARPHLPSDKISQGMTASSQTVKHTVVWHFLGCCNKGYAWDNNWLFIGGCFDKELARTSKAAKLVRSVQSGDCVALRIRARSLYSENLIQKVKIIVYWAV